MSLNWCCKCDFFLCLAFIIKLRHVPYKSVYLCYCSWIIMRVAFKVHFTFQNHSIWPVYSIMVLVANFLHSEYFGFEMFNAIRSRRNIWHVFMQSNSYNLFLSWYYTLKFYAGFQFEYFSYNLSKKSNFQILTFQMDQQKQI